MSYDVELKAKEIKELHVDLENRSFGSRMGWLKFELDHVSGQATFRVSSVWIR